MNSRFLKVLPVALLLGGVGACFTPSAEPGGSTGSTGTSTGGGATSAGSGGGTSTGGTTSGQGTSGGSTGGGNSGPMCPATCPTIHSHCDSSTGMCVCDPGYDQCGTACVSLASDTSNCGACFHACDAANGYGCINSTCVCGGTGLFGLCPGVDGGPDVCSDPLSDPHNCFYCGNDCGALTCSNGSCTCNSPLYECTGNDGGAYCADISRDIDNCGKCGALCGPTSESRDQRAIAWQCVSTTGGPGICACKTGFFQCPIGATATDCVDLASDVFNCGSCNNVCDGGASCVASHCNYCKGVGKGCFDSSECCPPLSCDQNTNRCSQ